MNNTERVLGILYIFFHSALLPMLLVFLFALFDFDLSGPYGMLVYYTAGFVLVLAIMHKFLRTSFSDLIDGFWRAIQAMILGYAFYRVLLWLAILLLSQVMTGANPNQEAVVADIRADLRVMLIVTAVLAPIVEEAVFRGALFGTIRQKSRIAAYVISVLLFSMFHMWSHLLLEFSWEALLVLVQYIPASIALAWCYERGGTIWSPILLHSVINLLGALQVAR